MTLEDRLAALPALRHATAKRMFGGTCFMLGEHMVAGTFRGGLLVRVGKEAHLAALKRPGARVFDMTGRPMQGYVSVDGKAVASDAALADWVDLAVRFVMTLPPKKAAPRKR